MSGEHAGFPPAPCLVTDGVGLKRGKCPVHPLLQEGDGAPRVDSSWGCWHASANTIPVYFRFSQLPKQSSFFTKKSQLQHVTEAHRFPTCPSSCHPLSQLLPTSSLETASVLTNPSILWKLLGHISALCHRHITNRGLHPAGLEIHLGCLL